jgi:lysophospholipase L1-like esterase
VVLLGDAFIERMQAHGYLESLWAAAYPERNIHLRNLGWSGDSVTGIARAVFGSPAEGFDRLVRDVLAARPTVILVAYGGNEAFAGPSGLADFTAGLNRLLDTLEETGARLVLLSPHRRLAAPPPLPDFEAYNRDLKQYCDVLRAVAKERRLVFVDLYDLLEAAGGDAPRPTTDRLTDNGLHLSQYGYWYVAPLMAKRLGIPLPSWELTLTADAGDVKAIGVRVSDWSTTERGLRCRIQDRSLNYVRAPVDNAPSRHPLVPAGKLTVTRLPPGTYQLRLDGQALAQATHAQWQAGMVLPHLGDEARFEQLRGEIARKNALYFHRYRPQNETYLFLFRKHEQGNNAVEIPQFDPLIAQAEERVARLARPERRMLELRRVAD